MTRADEPHDHQHKYGSSVKNETDVPAHLLQLLHNTKLLRCLVIVYSSSYSLAKSNLRMLSKAVDYTKLNIENGSNVKLKKKS